MISSRTRKLVEEAIERFQLDLQGLTVLTEAATGYYALTPEIAALAGAQDVIALGRDSSREDPRIAEADIITNLGFVRPLDKKFLEQLKKTAVIPLMWETWEFRPEELDLVACRELGIPVLGTNEHDDRLRTFEYTGLIAVKLLLEQDIEIFQSRIIVVGSGIFAEDVMKKLHALEAHLTLLPGDALHTERAKETLRVADALVIAEEGHLDLPSSLQEINPSLAIAHIIGGTSHMKVTTAYVGPKPLIDLHTAGLKVGEEMARLRLSGHTAEETQMKVLEKTPLAQGWEIKPVPSLDRSIGITVDLDWAPDFMIEDVLGILLKNKVKATFFATHESELLTRLQEYPELFEVGIHPNFLPGSTHGKDHEAVLDHCMKLVPTAKSMRTHGLVQSTQIFQRVLTQTRIQTDVSLLLPNVSPLVPFEHRFHKKGLFRIPYGWEDTFAMESESFPEKPLDMDSPGLKVFAFHPVHVFLNSRSMEEYKKLKEEVPDLKTACREEVERFINKGVGIRTRFVELVGSLSGSSRSKTIDEMKSLCLYPR